MNAQTILNAVTGHPLSHTQSPQIHAAIYKAKKINAVMLALPSEKIAPVITAMRTLPIHLLAVTIPHKQEVMKHLDHIDAVAKKVGAVNTVINRNGKLHGYNTDVIGIEKALARTKLRSKNVLVLGAGGAASAICYILKKHGAKIFCHNRTEKTAQKLMKEFGGQPVTEKGLAEAKFDLIINTTPLGMKPHLNQSPIAKKLLRRQQTIFDLIYNPAQTQLLKDAKKIGAKTINGLPMLKAQALAQIELLTSKL